MVNNREFFVSAEVIQPTPPPAPTWGVIAFAGTPVDSMNNEPIYITSQTLLTNSIASPDINEVPFNEDTDAPFWFLPLPTGLSETILNQQLARLFGKCRTVIFSAAASAAYQASQVDFDGVKVWTNTTSGVPSETIQLKPLNCLFSDLELEGKAFWTFMNALKVANKIGFFIAQSFEGFSSQFQSPSDASALRQARISAWIEGLQGAQSLDVYIGGNQAQTAYQYYAVEELIKNESYAFVQLNKPYNQNSINEFESILGSALDSQLVRTSTPIIDGFTLNFNTIESQSPSDKVAGIMNIGQVNIDLLNRIARINITLQGVL